MAIFSRRYIIWLIPCNFRIVPNCVMKAKSEKKRLFVGDQIKECRDASGLYYILPYQKVIYSLPFLIFLLFNSRLP